MIKKIIYYQKRHWKTTVGGLLVAILTGMLITKHITVDEWATGIGTIVTVIGVLAKDWDKTEAP